MPNKKNHNPSYNFKKILSVLLVFVMGVLFGLFLQKQLLYKQGGQNKDTSQEKRIGDYSRLTNPLLECDPNIGSDRELDLVKYSLTNYIKEKVSNNEATHISVYIRDLNNGPWVGISEKEGFAPDSLLKIPIMMACLKLAEKNPAILNKVIPYTKVISKVAPNIIPKETIQIGNLYTVNELLYRMIVYSDNEAKNLLLLNMNQDDLDRVYTDLHVILPDVRTKEDFISVKEYATFFRILYNASYLNREMSEKALGLLTQVDFRDGLLAGLPLGIKVAHKFGERVDSSGLIQLHECGIVYYNRSPYLLGVMTRGNDFNRLKDIIRDISKIVYKHKEKYKD